MRSLWSQSSSSGSSATRASAAAMPRDIIACCPLARKFGMYARSTAASWR
ncbi:MAG: hypothetical protein IPN17_23310 [Deltaproteobacteria bacterium]|nr:hypothetical protein [Deltaproteobacteria bacterium]